MNLVSAKHLGRTLVLTTAFLGWFCAGMLMSTTTLAMRSAAIDLLARSGSIDRQRFQALTRSLQDQEGKEEALPAEDRTQLRTWRAAAQSWFAYYQCAMLLGASAGGFLFGLLVMPVGDAAEHMLQAFRKTESGALMVEDLCAVRFVDLVAGQTD